MTATGTGTGTVTGATTTGVLGRGGGRRGLGTGGRLRALTPAVRGDTSAAAPASDGRGAAYTGRASRLRGTVACHGDGTTGLPGAWDRACPVAGRVVMGACRGVVRQFGVVWWVVALVGFWRCR